VWERYLDQVKAVVATDDYRKEWDWRVKVRSELKSCVRKVVGNAEDSAEALKTILKRATPGFIFHVNTTKLGQWLDDRPQECLEAVRALWAAAGEDVEAAIGAFSKRLPSGKANGTSYGIGGVGSRLTVTSSLLWARRPDWPPFKRGILKWSYDRTNRAEPEGNSEETHYRQSLRFYDRIVAEASARGLAAPANRDQAQIVVWLLHKNRIELDCRKNGQCEVHPNGLAALAGELHFPPEDLELIRDLLAEKPQAIFQGPPGTGKTYVARKLARCLAGSDYRVTLVQFHPSYAYEDFVQGYRPTLNEAGQAAFELRSGPLLRAAEAARAEPGEKHFLIIDEINRGNLSKVLGELYFLLEYRSDPVRLQYSEEEFRLPPNLHIIGTMNTADRSIALVDLALRRRFNFVNFHPDKPPVKGVLARWLEANHSDLVWLARVVDLANEKLDDHEAAIGPSYFMKADLTEALAERIWKHNVLPYLQEHLFGAGDGLDEFEFDKLRRVVLPS